MDSTGRAGASRLYIGLWIWRVGRNDEKRKRSQIVGKVQKLLKLQRLSEVHGLKVSFRVLNEFLDAEFGKTRKLTKCRTREDFIASYKRKERLTQLYGNRERISEKQILRLSFNELSHPEDLKLEDKVEMLFPKDNKNARMKEEEFVFEVCLGEEKCEVKAEFDSGASITVAGVDSLDIPKQILEKCMVIEAREIIDASNAVAMMDGYVSVKLRIGVKNTTVWITVPEVKLWIVNKPQWSNLLIGKDILKLLELMPEQVLFNRIQEQVDLQRNDAKLIKSIGKDITIIRNRVIPQI
eukprot:snap_masked-scaffold_57-processed-gene-0.39-mRNA-1 protein AED:1.00 eAED:1.00 QI:0/0/0/0/1/1/2/0/295